jgi:hypothetical protein
MMVLFLKYFVIFTTQGANTLIVGYVNANVLLISCHAAPFNSISSVAHHS